MKHDTKSKAAQKPSAMPLHKYRPFQGVDLARPHLAERIASQRPPAGSPPTSATVTRPLSSR